MSAVLYKTITPPIVSRPVGMPPWITGGAWPPFIEVDPERPLFWSLRLENRSDCDTAGIDIESVLKLEGICSEAEKLHLATIIAWTLWLMSTEGLDVRPWKPSSLPGLFWTLRRATAWMVREGFGRWDRLGRSDLERLKADLYHPDRSKAPVGTTHRGNTLLALRMLFSFHRLWGRMPDGLAIDPNEGDVDVVRRVLATHRKENEDPIDRGGSTRSIPWPLAQSFLGTAIEMIEGPDVQAIIRLEGIARDCVEGYPSDWKSDRRNRHAAKHFRKIAQTDEGIAALLHRQPLESLTAVFQLHRDLVTACYIVISTFAALRVSEAAAIEVDQAVENRQDGPWMTTTVLKTSPEEGGSRIRKVVPPVVAKAVEVATSATAGTRGVLRELLISHDHDRRRTVRFTKMVVTARLKHFALRRADIGPDRWAFASHQFRKLFVQVYVRRFEGSVEALQQHLGHVSARMIEAYLHDPDILRMIASEQKDLTAEIMAGVMTGSVRAGGRPAEAWLADAVAYRAKNMSVSEIAAVLRGMLDEQGMYLEPTTVGYCVSSPSTGARGLCGRNRLGLPDHANRTDGMCLACPNGVSTESSEARLKAEYLVHRQVIDDPQASSAMRDASERRCRLIGRRIEELATLVPGVKECVQ